MTKAEYKKVHSAIRRAQYIKANQHPSVSRSPKAQLIDALINIRSHGIQPYSKSPTSRVNVRLVVRAGLKSDQSTLSKIGLYTIRKKFDYFSHSQSLSNWRHPILANGKMGLIWGGYHN